MEKLKRGATAKTSDSANLTPDEPTPAPVADNRRLGRLLVVFSGKGGIGKSLLAVNLAASLAKEPGRRTAILDLDLQFGDIGVLLGLESGRNIYQVVEAFPNVDADFLDALMPEASGGLRVMLGPQSPEFADLVTAEHARVVLEILQATYDYIVVDTSSHLGEVTLEALERASQIVVMVDLSLPAVKEAKLALRVFQRLGISSDRIKVVLNRADSTLGITAAQVESSLETKIAVKLPTDMKTVLKSVQRAEPFVDLQANAEISQRVREFALSLLPLHAADGARTSPQERKGAFWSRTTAG